MGPTLIADVAATRRSRWKSGYVWGPQSGSSGHLLSLDINFNFSSCFYFKSFCYEFFKIK